jgi:hypothetical protein
VALMGGGVTHAETCESYTMRSESFDVTSYNTVELASSLYSIYSGADQPSEARKRSPLDKRCRSYVLQWRGFPSPWSYGVTAPGTAGGRCKVSGVDAPQITRIAVAYK